MTNQHFHHFIAILLFSISMISNASAQRASSYEQLIYQEKQEKILTYLADDMNEGRASGTNGNENAERLIVEKFKEYGLQPYHWNYTQSFMYDDSIAVRNVTGIIFASTPSDEYIIVSAHYDHIGKLHGTIYNGADDNASGVTALLNIAEMYGAMKRDGVGPHKNIIFVAFDGKELSMAGSKYFVKEMLSGGSTARSVDKATTPTTDTKADAVTDNRTTISTTGTTTASTTGTTTASTTASTPGTKNGTTSSTVAKATAGTASSATTGTTAGTTIGATAGTTARRKTSPMTIISSGGLYIPKSKIICNINIDMLGTDFEPTGSNPEFIIMLGEERLNPKYQGIVSYICSRAKYKMDLDLTFYGSREFRKTYYTLSDQYSFAREGIPAVL
ncbi:MAG: M28 family peptidase, partial [Bacteroidales bacterium]|nr:M28 family peptidase [Bacteroidales bacterium]